MTESAEKNFPAYSHLPYTKQVSAIYSLIENTMRENNSLTELRDTLLPKLLSGEITLPEAEQIISEEA